VAWFQQVYATLGAEHWAVVAEAAKYASSGTGHGRARLFADALLGATTRDELTVRMLQRRNQDAARALGLLPLPAGEAREPELMARYQALQEFVRSGRRFGSQRRANEQRAAAMGLANLARTACYAEPARLEWAMEARSGADLAEGLPSITEGDLSIALVMD